MNENRFDGKGKIYAKYRPAYPMSLIQYLYDEVGITKQSVIADIGAGTGKLTKLLLEQGHRVYAVEPNEDMREIAENNLQGYSDFVSVAGTAEQTQLAPNSVNFVTAAQAFHWFDREGFKKECERILMPGGKVILVWNSRDPASELVIENEIINRQYCKNFKGFSGNMCGAEKEADFIDFFSGQFETQLFENDLFFDESGFIGRNLSSSYAPKETDRHYNDYISALKVLFWKYCKENLLCMPNITRCYAGKV